MPRNKPQSTKVSDFFSPAKGEAPMSQGAGNKALTKDDFLASLRPFKAELREELTAELRSALEALQSGVTGHLTSLQAGVESVGTSTLDLETQVLELKQQKMERRQQCWVYRKKMETMAVRCRR
ncbi:hypothetical protein NDU88_004154 [Pleurodeles waltl]|uniref:Uncharacterized protein n=1 Tax=Pleurodeles waltl TaxID=8319 RepID=A0AAV7MUD0_PLEWA|nr:hypothetical protein NDU88_004154 [Pleurodeles waltl]